MKSRDYLNILQITDIHFRKNVEGTIYGIETQILFEKTLAQIKHELDSGSQKLDLVLATGDISQDGSSESYHRFHQFMEQLDAPCYYLQGNHDYVQPMISEFGIERVAPCRVSADEKQGSPWEIVLLNSSVEDQVEGHFGKEQLDFMKQNLKACGDSPVLLCFHHHPMLINCQWLDKQVIDDAQQFFDVLDEFTNVKLCIYGHVHQERLSMRKSLPFYATPSTCAQFKPEMDDFALDEQAPAYRWIRCYQDGSFETEVVRLNDFSLAL